MLYGEGRDFEFLLRLDAERSGLHFPGHLYWQRYFAAKTSGVTGATLPGRTFQWVGGNVSAMRTGCRLRLLNSADEGEYTIAALSGGFPDQLTVTRDWPVGGQSSVEFVMELDDLYGDQLPNLQDRYVQRAARVPMSVVLQPPRQTLAKYGFDENAEGVFEISRGLTNQVPHQFVPNIGDIIQCVDGLKYELLTVKPWDWVGSQHDHWLHRVGTLQRTHRDIPDSVPVGAIR